MLRDILSGSSNAGNDNGRDYGTALEFPLGGRGRKSLTVFLSFGSGVVESVHANRSQAQILGLFCLVVSRFEVPIL